MKEYGYFSKNGYVITDRDTPRHWYNYMFNDDFITSVSQVGFGQGFAQDNMGRRLMVVEDRAIYISDGERIWQANGLPIHKQLQHYHCEHGIGYTDIVLTCQRIHSECRFFVPTEGKREYLRLTLKNESRNTKTLKVMPYYATGGECAADRAAFDDSKNCVIAMGYHAFESSEPARQYTYLLATDTVTGFDTRQSAFIGTYGNKLQPKALIENKGCTNSECIGEKQCLVLENTVTLEPGESKTFYYTVGVERDPEQIPQFLPAEIEEQFIEMQTYHKDICDAVRIHTPWDDLNDLFNDWLKYQANLGSRWANVQHNGIRELADNSECLGSIHPQTAAERLCRAMSYQYDNGYAPRTFIDGIIKDDNSSDNAVWLVFAAYALAKELGDINFLLRKVPFTNGSEATVYEHAKRALQFLWNFTGHSGLIKIWGGDRNDCMDHAGLAEKGVSIWLSIAFVRAAKMFSQMANWIGSEADSKAAAHFAKEMEKRVNRHAWDGDRYICAVSDDKHLIGSKNCKEGALFALPQLWSLLAGFDRERSMTAIDTLEQQLNTDLGLLISHPPYTEQLPYIGTVTQKHPGLQENGGIDLQAAAWKIAVDAVLKRNDKIEEGLRKILPEHHEFYTTEGEPYVLFDYYFGEQTDYRAGKPGQSWRSAAGPWLMYSLVRFVYGLQPEFGGLLIKPCLPISWQDCSVSKLFRNCRYNIHYVQKDKGACNTIDSIYVNGQQVNAQLPIKPQPQKTLDVEVILRK